MAFVDLTRTHRFYLAATIVVIIGVNAAAAAIYYTQYQRAAQSPAQRKKTNQLFKFYDMDFLVIPLPIAALSNRPDTDINSSRTLGLNSNSTRILTKKGTFVYSPTEGTKWQQITEKNPQTGSVGQPAYWAYMHVLESFTREGTMVQEDASCVVWLVGNLYGQWSGLQVCACGDSACRQKVSPSPGPEPWVSPVVKPTLDTCGLEYFTNPTGSPVGGSDVPCDVGMENVPEVFLLPVIRNTDLPECSNRNAFRNCNTYAHGLNEHSHCVKDGADKACYECGQCRWQPTSDELRNCTYGDDPSFGHGDWKSYFDSSCLQHNYPNGIVWQKGTRLFIKSVRTTDLRDNSSSVELVPQLLPGTQRDIDVEFDEDVTELYVTYTLSMAFASWVSIFTSTVTAFAFLFSTAVKAPLHFTFGASKAKYKWKGQLACEGATLM